MKEKHWMNICVVLFFLCKLTWNDKLLCWIAQISTGVHRIILGWPKLNANMFIEIYLDRLRLLICSQFGWLCCIAYSPKYTNKQMENTVFYWLEQSLLSFYNFFSLLFQEIIWFNSNRPTRFMNVCSLCSVFVEYFPKMIFYLLKINKTK